MTLAEFALDQPYLKPRADPSAGGSDEPLTRSDRIVGEAALRGDSRLLSVPVHCGIETMSLATASGSNTPPDGSDREGKDKRGSVPIDIDKDVRQEYWSAVPRRAAGLASKEQRLRIERCSPYRGLIVRCEIDPPMPLHRKRQCDGDDRRPQQRHLKRS